MAVRSETGAVYAAALVQGVALVTFPAASTIFTSPNYYDLSGTAYGGMFLPQAVTAISASLIGAGLTRQWGIKRVFVLGLLANLASMLLLLLSQLAMTDQVLAYGVLLLATASLGIGFGLTVPSLNSLIAAFFPATVDRAILTLNALLGLGTVLAPVFVAVFVGLGSWSLLPLLVAVSLGGLVLFCSRLPLQVAAQASPAASGHSGIPSRFWLFAAFACLYGIVETMNGNWASLYMANDLGASNAQASLALTAFWGMVTAGRVLFALVERSFPEQRTYHLLPFVAALAMVMLAVLPTGSVVLGIVAFGIAGLGCSALLPLTISFGQGARLAMAASIPGLLIAVYQVGYGIAAFGVGPLERFTTLDLRAIYGLVAIVALAMGALSFVVVPRPWAEPIDAASKGRITMTEPFNGVIKLDVRDSTPDWTPYTLKRAPAGAPNVLIVLYDDTGLAAWSPYGGRINMPTMDRLAANGLTYAQWHTTALCSPTRSTFLTGRNHHVNRSASIVEGSDGFPGAAARLPAECATIAQVLQDNGYSTYWLGKNHNIPEEDWSSGGSKSEWPLQKGFDRFYGFLGGETNNWYPDLVEDNRYVDQPYAPEDGYHLSKDLADQALRLLRDQQSANPSKPWFMWFCPGANHAPHHSPQEYADKYKGKFDDGYEAYREWVLQRMIQRGIVPEGTALTPINPLPEDVAATSPRDAVRPWNTLNEDEKKLFARMAEVFAGFSEYTDAQVGRVVDYLEQTNQLDNTIIFYCADNGASGEGSPDGSVNENKFFNGYPDELSENMQYLDALGGPDTYNHYPTGWAAAFSTPFQMFKRYSQFAGGTCDPLVIHWPRGIKARGEVRHQYHHSTDIVPTILDVTGLEMPTVYRGVEQFPLSGVSMRYTFDDGAASTKKQRQYFAMLGTRGIWQDGWKAAALHAPISGVGHFDQDRWELYHVDVDRSESKNLAAEHPEKLQELIAAWFEEADKNFVLPLDDRTPIEVIAIARPQPEPSRTRFIYYPNTTAVPESVAVNIRGRSYKIIADVNLTAHARGVIFAHGSRFGGHALFLKDMKLYYVYNFLGIKPEQTFVSPLLTAGKHTLGMEFTRERAGQFHESLGTTRLYVNDEVVAEGPMRAQISKFTLCGDGLCVGYDSSDRVSSQYEANGNNGAFEGGTILGVGVDVSPEAYLDLEREAAAALARD